MRRARVRRADVRRRRLEMDCADESIAPLFCARACACTAATRRHARIGTSGTGGARRRRSSRRRRRSTGRRRASRTEACCTRRATTTATTSTTGRGTASSARARATRARWTTRCYGTTRSPMARGRGGRARPGGQCDRRMNNIFWRFDKGDCCLSTCAPSSLYDATCAFWGETVGATAAGGPLREARRDPRHGGAWPADGTPRARRPPPATSSTTVAATTTESRRCRGTTASR